MEVLKVSFEGFVLLPLDRLFQIIAALYVKDDLYWLYLKDGSVTPCIFRVALPVFWLHETVELCWC